MNEKPEQALIGCQLSLISPSKREPLQREEWRRLVAIGVKRRHQQFSRTDRASAQAQYRYVFGSGRREHPPIA